MNGKIVFFFTATALGFINSQDLMPKKTGGNHIWVALSSYSSYLIREEKAVDASSTDGFLVMNHMTREPNVLLHTAAKTYCKLEEQSYF